MSNLTVEEVGVIIACLGGIVFGYLKLKKQFLAETNARLDSQDKAIAEIQKDSKIQMRMLYCLLQHQATGDHVNDMNQLLSELQDHIMK